MQIFCLARERISSPALVSAAEARSIQGEQKIIQNFIQMKTNEGLKNPEHFPIHIKPGQMGRAASGRASSAKLNVRIINDISIPDRSRVNKGCHRYFWPAGCRGELCYCWVRQKGRGRHIQKQWESRKGKSVEIKVRTLHKDRADHYDVDTLSAQTTRRKSQEHWRHGVVFSLHKRFST